MAAKKFARGELRETAINIMKSNHLSKSSKPETFDAVVKKIKAKIMRPETTVRSIMNFCLREGMVGGAKAVASKKSAKKAPAKKVAKKSAKKSTTSAPSTSGSIAAAAA